MTDQTRPIDNDWEDDLFGGRRKTYDDVKTGKRTVMFQSEEDVAENARRNASGGKSEYPHKTVTEGDDEWHHSNTKKGPRIPGTPVDGW